MTTNESADHVCKNCGHYGFWHDVEQGKRCKCVHDRIDGKFCGCERFTLPNIRLRTPLWEWNR